MANQTGYKATTSFSEDVLCGTDFCSHCSADDLTKAVGYFYEKDSFGFVFAEIVCEGCRDEGLKNEGEEKVCCHDCKGAFPKKETCEWRWYDFYAPQGDEPLVICNNCWGAPKHQARVAKDNADYTAEFGYDDWDESDD